MHPALEQIAQASRGTEFENQLWIVGGAVRDELLGLAHKNDFDLVTVRSAPALAELLFQQGVSAIAPVVYARFGTAMLQIADTQIELITARKESYDESSRKPEVEPTTLEEDARRRDFTCNALLRNLHSGELYDPLGNGLEDLKAKVLRTPLEPQATFYDDPLRMLRAVRFRWQLGFTPAPGLYEAIHETKERLAIISAERIRDELFKMLLLESAPDALQDLMDLELLDIFAAELRAMVDVEQGSYHHLDVWKHSLLVLKNVGPGDIGLSLAALLHDVGKPPTRFIDEEGNTRFFGHESVGEEMSRKLLRGLKLPEKDIDRVALLVRNHMRLGSSPEFSPAAARRLIRDMDGEVESLLKLVEADASALKRGVKKLDLTPIRQRLQDVQKATPKSVLISPLSGEEIMEILGVEAGPEVGRWKNLLTEKVLEGEILPGDKGAAKKMLRKLTR